MSNFLLFLTMYQLHSYNYYPFGSPMPERSFSSPSYRYGFQGQEKDDEVKGAGLSINYKYRMHDPRLGRFFAVDPLASKYPYNSPYAFSENRLIDGVELEGLEVLLINKEFSASYFGKVGGEYGVIIDNNEVMSYGGWNVGISNEVAFSTGYSITSFPTMPDLRNATGDGYSVSYSFGEGVSFGYGFAYSDGHVGTVTSIGVGGSSSPVGVAASYHRSKLMVVNDVETLEFTKMLVNSMRGQLLIKQKQIRAQFYSLAPKVVLARTEFNKADAALTKFINGKADYIQKHSVDEYFSEVQSLFADAYEKNGKLEALKYKAEKIWDALEESKSQQKILSDKVKLIESKLEHE